MAIFQSLAFLAFASHLRTMFTDPVIEIMFNIYLLYIWIYIETRYIMFFWYFVYRVRYQKVMQRKRWYNKWDLEMDKLSLSVQNVVLSSLTGHIIALFVKGKLIGLSLYMWDRAMHWLYCIKILIVGVLGKWIIIVHGSTIVWEKIIKNILYFLLWVFYKLHMYYM